MINRFEFRDRQRAHDAVNQLRGDVIHEARNILVELYNIQIGAKNGEDEMKIGSDGKYQVALDRQISNEIIDLLTGLQLEEALFMLKDFLAVQRQFEDE